VSSPSPAAQAQEWLEKLTHAKGKTVEQSAHTPRSLRIGGKVAEQYIVRKVHPVYPAQAKAARIQGSVEFTVVISPNGDVAHVELVRGHPLLVNAALEAVLHGKYRPSLLNGQAVEIITDVVINFTLVD
jgi:periplasmic protein TonB